MKRNLFRLSAELNSKLTATRLSSLPGLVDKMKYGFVVYVNGFIRAEWSMNDCEIRRRFYYESKKSLLKSSEKAKIKKMRKSVREEIMKSAQYSVFLPYWGSFSRLKSHLIKNNQSIELVE